MKKICSLAIFMVCSLILLAQQTEDQIPFTLDSDMDGMDNIIDNDDDNDLVLDNLDYLPLDPNISFAINADSIVSASDDAGLRNNTNSNANKNYGSDATVQTKNDARSFIMKFPTTAGLPLSTATLTIYTDSEDDELALFYLPTNAWSESTITYNTADFSGSQLLGTMNSPIDGKYTFDIPLNLISQIGGEITLWVYDPSDPTNKTENLLTKEYLGDGEGDNLGDQAPTLTFNYNVLPDPRLVVDPPTAQSAYVDGDMISVAFSLIQQPTSEVYLPIEVSDTSIAKISGTQVLTFDPNNWNTPQTLIVDPISPGIFDINVRPIHSLDTFYNGHNEFDLEGYTASSTDIQNITGWTIATGESLDTTALVANAVGSSVFDFRIIEAPSGFNVIENSGRFVFSPLSNQIGEHGVIIEITDEFGNISMITTTINVTDGGASDPVGLIVDLNLLDDPNANGSVSNPYNEISAAIDSAANNINGIPVFVRGGEFELTAIETITAAATESNKVVVKPLNGEHVKFNFNIRSAFEFTTEARHIEFQGFELDGRTDEIDFWCIVGQSVFGDLNIPRGGGIAFLLNGQHITIKNNYIHDAYQKALEIRDGRYINAFDNIISFIATTSISGGHGIMRQQKGQEFFDDDDPNYYRWDLSGNLIFNVEQRIYSWVPLKGFMEMTLDEGKPILIDDPKDSDGIQEAMKARIKNNVVAFGSIDLIRLKSTPGLEVSHNSLYAFSPHADGITDKGGDSDTPQFIDFIARNNAVHTLPGTTAIELDDCIDQSNPANNPGSTAAVVTGNIAVGGSVKPTNTAGLTMIGATNLFIDPESGNFRIDPTSGQSDAIGADTTNLNRIDSLSDRFGVNVEWDGWVNDDLKLTQSILDNIPHLNDGIEGNETVFMDYGVINEERLDIDFDIVAGGPFQTQFDAPDTMQFRLNHDYVDWYLGYDTMYLSAPDMHYERIRYGNSEIKKIQVFDPNWLTVSEITSDSTHTLINGPEYDFTLDGDYLISFKDFTPELNECFDLMLAKSIVGAGLNSLFDSVMFDGFMPDTFSLTVETTPAGEVLRLKILEDCDAQVNNTLNDGSGSLRAAIDCAQPGDTIILMGLQNDTIKLMTPLLIDKDISIISQQSGLNIQNCSNTSLQIGSDKNVHFKNFNVLSDDFMNSGNLKCTDITFKSKSANSQTNFINAPSATIDVENSVRIE